ncbi:hypothetical protein IFM89_019947 [Coptis chinensis]|uniref:Uncharacterized protein n=1 Tax=Coptis chinensis TaxID=261450 RepID=A0A835LN63_9MAGN|nr:hypothetical protein IFM89_019947 [Coptis chinensis]
MAQTWQMQIVLAKKEGMQSWRNYVNLGLLCMPILGTKLNLIDVNLRAWEDKGYKVSSSTCDLTVRFQREKLIETVSTVFNGKLNIIVSSNPQGRVLYISLQPFST